MFCGCLFARLGNHADEPVHQLPELLEQEMCGKGNGCDRQKNCQSNQPARTLLFEHLAHDLPAQPFLDAVKFQAECAEKDRTFVSPMPTGLVYLAWLRISRNFAIRNGRETEIIKFGTQQFEVGTRR